MNKIREEMKQKELLKEAEAKRRGMSLFMPAPCPIPMNVTLGMYRKDRGREGARRSEGAD